MLWSNYVIKGRFAEEEVVVAINLMQPSNWIVEWDDVAVMDSWDK